MAEKRTNIGQNSLPLQVLSHKLLLNDIFGGFAVIYCGFVDSTVWSFQSIVVSLLLYSWNQIAWPLILDPKRGGSSIFVLQLFDFSSNWRVFFLIIIPLFS